MSRAGESIMFRVVLILLVFAGAIDFAGRVSGRVVVAQEPATSAEVKKDIEILNLKTQLTTATKQISDLQAVIGACQAQLGPLALERNQAALGVEQKTIIETYERANPGFTLDPSTWKPVKKPAPPETKPKG